MNLKESIDYKMADFLSLCKAHNVKNLYAFGSSITDEFNELFYFKIILPFFRDNHDKLPGKFYEKSIRCYFGQSF